MAFKPGSASVTGEAVGHTETDGEHVFSGVFSYAGTGSTRVSDWTVTFDKRTGFLSGFSVGGVEMLSGPLTPEFSRAPVENDMGARLFRDDRMGVWRYPVFSLESMDVSEEPEGWRVVCAYAPIAGGAAAVKLSFLVRPDGSVQGSEVMEDAGGLDKAPDLFRYGMKFTMPGRWSTVDFYGRGPWENYSDRNSSAKVGRYVQTVGEQYHYGYVRPQESGTHTGLKYLRLLDADGWGLEITSPERFSGSALPFSIRELDCMENGTPIRSNATNTQAGEARHSLDLKALAYEGDRVNGKTYVTFEQVQMGVGGINSWGTWPLEEYRVHAGERVFDFIIRPFAN